MGYTSYSSTSRSTSTRGKHYATASMNEIFKEKSMNLAMNPYNVGVREARDSEAHPNSLAIVLALDVTGSMGSIPNYLVKTGLPHFIDSMIEGGVKDPAVLFTGVGDHECDRAPLQVGQFESGDEELDHWLTKLYLEGGGGGNDGESYLLAWYFAAKHTSIDCWDKRKQKGFIFTIGDEPTLREIPKNSLKEVMGDGQFENMNSATLLDMARERYHVYHLHLRQGSNGNRQDVMDGWRQLMGDNLIIVDRKEDVADIMSKIVVENMVGKSKQPVISETIKEETEVIL